MLKKHLIGKRHHNYNNQCRKYGCKLIGDFLGCPHPCWYHPKAITDIMAYYFLADHYRITYDNHIEYAVLLHKNKNKINKFVRSKCGMCYHNLINHQVSLINNVKDNEVTYTRHLLEQAKFVRGICVMVGYPSIIDLKNMI